MSDLLPCPFCGCRANYRAIGREYKYAHHTVTCTRCEAAISRYDKNETGAIAAWNKRNVTASAVYGYEAGVSASGQAFAQLSAYLQQKRIEVRSQDPVISSSLTIFIEEIEWFIKQGEST